MQTKAILLASCIVLFGLPANAAEKASGVTSGYQTVSTLNSAIPDKAGHSVRQVVQTYKSTGSSDLANFSATNVAQQDVLGGDIKGRAYGINQHANGDLSYVSAEGTTKITPKEGGAFELIGSGTFKWIGGTGKYQKLSGDGTYSCKGTQAGTECQWEGEAQY
jgi:hypothetical protein